MQQGMAAVLRFGAEELARHGDVSFAPSFATCPLQEEMAAILRFGAEELFRHGHDAAADEAQGQKVVEEDLDAILARAEVRQLPGSFPAASTPPGSALVRAAAKLPAACCCQPRHRALGVGK